MQARKQIWQAPPWIADGAISAAGLAALGVGIAYAFRFLSISSLTNTWLLTRAAGIAAFVLLWFSVLGGLLQSTGILTRIMRPAVATDLHNTTGVWAIYTTVFHMAVLLWNHYQPFSVAELLVPFSGIYKPLLMALGMVGTYLTLAATISSYFRAKLGPVWWRRLHLASLAGFLAALFHGILAGTDTGSPLMLGLYGLAAVSTIGLTLYRTYLGVMRNANSHR